MAYDNNYPGTGCLYSNSSLWSATWGNGNDLNPLVWDIDASRCSSVYSGTGNDLNPLSRTCKFFIRY